MFLILTNAATWSVKHVSFTGGHMILFIVFEQIALYHGNEFYSAFKCTVLMSLNGDVLMNLRDDIKSSGKSAIFSYLKIAIRPPPPSIFSCTFSVDADN